MEHERWLRQKVSQGWKYGPQRDEEAKTNPAMLPWRRLSEEERSRLNPTVAAAIGTDELPQEGKEKDRALVQGIPRILAKAG